MRSGFAKLLRAGIIGRVEVTLGPESKLPVLDVLFPPFRQVFDQAVPPEPYLGLGSRIRSQVVQLVRVVLEVEKLLFAVTSVEDVFITTVGEAAPVVFGAIACVVFEINVLSPPALEKAGCRHRVLSARKWKPHPGKSAAHREFPWVG